MAAYTLTIGGVAYEFEVSPFDIERSWTLNQPANGAGNFQCTAWADDVDDVPAMDAEIVLSEDGTPIFGGYIDEPTIHGIAGHPTVAVEAEINAHDYNILPSRRYVIALDIPAGTLKAALEAVMPYLTGYGVTLHASQVDGPTLPALSYSAWTVHQILEQLTEMSGGYVWRINTSKVLRMFQPGSLAAPFNLVEGNGTEVGDVVVRRTRVENYGNSIIVVGTGVTAVAQDAGEITAHTQWDVLVQAPDTNTQAAADALAAGILAASLPILTTVEYSTHELGLEPGMTQTITLPSRGVDNTYLLIELVTEGFGPLATRRVRAIEGLVYQPGWREQMRDWGGSGGGVTLPGTGAGGVGGVRYAYFLGGAGEGVRSSTPTWVDASPIAVQLSTVARATTLFQVTAQLRAFESGVSVQARLFDVTDGSPCAGLSAVVSSQTFQTVTWTVTLTPGSHYYRLQVLPGAADSDVAAIGYGE